MSQIDFSKPQTFLNTLETFALALNCALVALRNEVHFNDEVDQGLVNATQLFDSMLEDARTEVSGIGNQFERTLLAMADKPPKGDS